MPTGVVARADSAVVIAQRLLTRTDDELEQLEGVQAHDLLFLVGTPELLPWADGAMYLGRDPSAPALLLPTTLMPSVPLALLEQALLRQGAQPPLAIVPQWGKVLSFSQARPVARAVLQAWLNQRGQVI